MEKAEDCTEAAQQELKDSLKKALETIDKRQKLICLTDSSSYGWATVSEYEAHQLADDENDDNKITRAENRAGRKIKQKKAAAATQQQPKKFKWDNRGAGEPNNPHVSNSIAPATLDIKNQKSMYPVQMKVFCDIAS